MLLTLIATLKRLPFLEVGRVGGCTERPSIGPTLPLCDPDAKHGELCQTSPHCPLFKRPPPLYNPLLLSFSLCLLVKEPRSVRGARLSALSLPPLHPPFLILPQWNEGS